MSRQALALAVFHACEWWGQASKRELRRLTLSQIWRADQKLPCVQWASLLLSRPLYTPLAPAHVSCAWPAWQPPWGPSGLQALLAACPSCVHLHGALSAPAEDRGSGACAAGLPVCVGMVVTVHGWCCAALRERPAACLSWLSAGPPAAAAQVKGQAGRSASSVRASSHHRPRPETHVAPLSVPEAGARRLHRQKCVSVCTQGGGQHDQGAV